MSDNLPVPVQPAAPDVAEPSGFDVATASPADFTAELHARRDSGDVVGAQRLLDARNVVHEMEAESASLPDNPHVTADGALDVDSVWEVWDAFPEDADAMVDFMTKDGRGLAGVIADAHSYVKALTAKYPNTYDACRAIGVQEEVARRAAAAYPKTRDGLEARDIEGLSPYCFLDHPSIAMSAAQYWRNYKAANPGSDTTTQPETQSMSHPELEKRHRELTGEMMTARDQGDYAKAKALEAERAAINEQLPSGPIVGRGGRTA